MVTTASTQQQQHWTKQIVAIDMTSETKLNGPTLIFKTLNRRGYTWGIRSKIICRHCIEHVYLWNKCEEFSYTTERTKVCLTCPAHLLPTSQKISTSGCLLVTSFGFHKRKPKEYFLATWVNCIVWPIRTRCRGIKKREEEVPFCLTQRTGGSLGQTLAPSPTSSSFLSPHLT